MSYDTDLQLIHAYNDKNLSEADVRSFESRLEADDSFHDLFLSIKLNRFLDEVDTEPVPPPSPKLLALAQSVVSATVDVETGPSKPLREVLDSEPGGVKDFFSKLFRPQFVLPGLAGAMALVFVLVGPSSFIKTPPVDLTAGTVTFVRGDVEVDGEEVTTGAKFKVGDVLTTAKDAYAVLQFDENVLVTVKARSKVRYDAGRDWTEDTGQVHLHMRKGFLFNKIRTGTTDFRVTTPTLVAGVRGTEFSIVHRQKKGAGQTKVMVRKGSVEAAPAPTEASQELQEQVLADDSLTKKQKKALKKLAKISSQKVILKAGSKVTAQQKPVPIWKLPGFKKWKKKKQFKDSSLNSFKVSKVKKISKGERKLLANLGKVAMVSVKSKGKLAEPEQSNTEVRVLIDPKAKKGNKKGSNKESKKKTEAEILADIKDEFGSLTKITTKSGKVYIGGFETKGPKMIIYHSKGETSVLQKDVANIETYQE